MWIFVMNILVMYINRLGREKVRRGIPADFRAPRDAEIPDDPPVIERRRPRREKRATARV
jgi:hypothetical protein